MDTELSNLIENYYKLFASEKRVVMVMISMICPDADADPVHSYQVKTKDLIKEAELSGLSELKGITRKLQKQELSVQCPSRELHFNWVTSCDYMDYQGAIIGSDFLIW